MKKLLGIVVLGLLLSGCATTLQGTKDTENQKFLTMSYTTPTGGSITSHFIFGEKQEQLLQRAASRCKKLGPNFKVSNFRTTRQGGLIKGEMSEFNYDCENSVVTKKVESASKINKVKNICKKLGFKEGTEKFSDCTLKLYSENIEE